MEDFSLGKSSDQNFDIGPYRTFNPGLLGCFPGRESLWSAWRALATNWV
jgi:hypothetical protein